MTAVAAAESETAEAEEAVIVAAIGAKPVMALTVVIFSWRQNRK